MTDITGIKRAALTAKQERRRAREIELADKSIQRELFGHHARYNVIYADPPWRFHTYSEAGMDRSAENHYPCMALEDIKALDVPAADDAVLYLWATVPMLPEALEVMKAWGFTYKSQIAWAKDRIGTGYWARNKHEILLIGTKGKIPAPAMGTQTASIIEAPLGRHSQKPAIFAEIIEAHWPTVPKLEMFSRSPRPGWTAIGNEATFS